MKRESTTDLVHIRPIFRPTYERLTNGEVVAEGEIRRKKTANKTKNSSSKSDEPGLEHHCWMGRTVCLYRFFFFAFQADKDLSLKSGIHPPGLVAPRVWKMWCRTISDSLCRRKNGNENKLKPRSPIPFFGGRVPYAFRGRFCGKGNGTTLPIRLGKKCLWKTGPLQLKYDDRQVPTAEALKLEQTTTVRYWMKWFIVHKKTV